MLSGWVDEPATAARLAWLSEVCALDLAVLGTTADAADVRPTSVAQPLLVATGLVAAAAAAVAGTAPLTADVVAGHSVGEITAAALTGVLGPEQAVVLARMRGREMAASAVGSGSGMAALLGGDRDAILGAIDRLGLVAVNDNGPGNIVVSGPLPALTALCTERPGRATVVPLEISGGFHTAELGPVSTLLRGHVRAMAPRDPRIPLLTNLDGRVVRSGTEALEFIAGQVSAPVSWGACMRRMLLLEVTGLLELPPAGVLTGIARRAMPGVELFSLDSVDQLDDARAFVSRHLGVSAAEALPPVVTAVPAH